MTLAIALHVKNLIKMKTALLAIDCLIKALALITLYVIGLYVHLCFI